MTVCYSSVSVITLEISASKVYLLLNLLLVCDLTLKGISETDKMQHPWILLSDLLLSIHVELKEEPDVSGPRRRQTLGKRVWQCCFVAVMRCYDISSPYFPKITTNPQSRLIP